MGRRRQGEQDRRTDWEETEHGPDPATSPNPYGRLNIRTQGPMESRVRALLETVDLIVDSREEDAEELRQANLVQAMAQLAAGVAHEINNPAAYLAANL